MLSLPHRLCASKIYRLRKTATSTSINDLLLMSSTTYLSLLLDLQLLVLPAERRGGKRLAQNAVGHAWVGCTFLNWPHPQRETVTSPLILWTRQQNVILYHVTSYHPPGTGRKLIQFALRHCLLRCDIVLYWCPFNGISISDAITEPSSYSSVVLKTNLLKCIRISLRKCP